VTACAEVRKNWQFS